MIVGITKAAEITGLSAWELRTGIKQGKYPFMRTGSGGRNTAYLLDIEY